MRPTRPRRPAHGLSLASESDDLLAYAQDHEVEPAAELQREIVVPGVATFRVVDGTVVHIARAPGADPAAVEASLGGRVTAALLQQRRVLPLHLAAVVVQGRTLAFAGPPATGKSSLACAMADRGHVLLTDDLAAVTRGAAQQPMVHPGPPVMRLWGSSARQLGWPTGRQQRIIDGADKYAYELADRFATDPQPLTAVYVLLEHSGTDVRIQPVGGFEKFETYFSGATYNHEFIDTAAARAWHFSEVCWVAEHVATFILRRPAGELSLKKLAAEVERHASSLSVRA